MLKRGSCKRSALFVSAVGITALALPALAVAHLERPSYWPDPAPDTGVSPPAGGEVPSKRSLASAATGEGPGQVLVVCKGDDGKGSLRALRDSLEDAQQGGYKLRPSQPKIDVSENKAKKLKEINKKLAKRCGYDSVQEAVFDAGNNDRVAIMPGRYTEPESRSAPVNDPACEDLIQNDASGTPTPSYEYQVTCPNDQNLIYVQGRAVAGDPVVPPLEDRQGIPEQELGPCVRCNLQIEGTGVKPEDVILDAGTGYSGEGPKAKPSGYAKHVVMRVDRADGFVGRNFLTRGALEHGFYNEEVDGVRLERVKFYWAADYGHLSFTSDHNLIRNCEGFGAGDAVIYPGAAPETGSQATAFYPDAPRENTVVKKCDMHGSALGYSGSMGNAVRITDNHIYGNTAGISTDTLSASGHPGFPADSSEIDHNYIYSNNLDLYRDDAPVDILVGVPIGTGVLYAGINDANVHHNWFFDNWRDGASMFAVPDAATNGGGAEGDIFPGVSCPGAPDNGFSTSCGNRFHHNTMGVAPEGFKFAHAVGKFGNVSTADEGGRRKPNGNDFWWSELFASNTGNCWYQNTGVDGTADSVTGPGEAGGVAGAPPQELPSNCSTSTGNTDAPKFAYLIDCADGPDEDTGPTDCDWWTLPPEPGSPAARAARSARAEATEAYAGSPEAREAERRVATLQR